MLSKKNIIKENGIILHSFYDNLDSFNKYAKKSLEIDNDGKKRSRDEATSIHIITDILNTHLKIIYERQIYQFYGKPDFIIRLGKNMYIMVSVTRAIRHKKCKKNKYFTQEEANRLLRKKITGLNICKNNLKCLINEVINDKCIIRPILHILTPNKYNSGLCKIAYNNIIKEKNDISDIKVIISEVKNHTELL